MSGYVVLRARIARWMVNLSQGFKEHAWTGRVYICVVSAAAAGLTLGGFTLLVGAVGWATHPIFTAALGVTALGLACVVWVCAAATTLFVAWSRWVAVLASTLIVFVGIYRVIVGPVAAPSLMSMFATILLALQTIWYFARSVAPERSRGLGSSSISNFI